MRSRSPLLASSASSVSVALLQDDSEKQRVGVADLQAMLSIRGVGSRRSRRTDAMAVVDSRIVDGAGSVTWQRGKKVKQACQPARVRQNRCYHECPMSGASRQ